MSFSIENQKIKVVLSPSTKAVFDKCKYYKNIVLEKLNKTWKRAASFTSHYQKGSFSLEATMVTAAFLFGALVPVGLMIVIYQQQCAQIALDNVVKDTSKKIYFAEQVGKVVKDNKNIDIEGKLNELLKKNGIDKDNEYLVKAKKFMEDSMLDGYVKQQFLSEVRSQNDVSEFFGRRVSGLDFSKSSYEKKSGQLVIIAKYNVKIPFVPSSIGMINAEKRAFIKVWNGKSVCSKNNKVYITKQGKVYHTRKDCSHISINMCECSFKNIGEKRNDSGGKYYRCPRCCKTKPDANQTVYYTEYGTTYHTDFGCGSITRNVIEVDISQVGDIPPCKDCSGDSERE